MNKCEQNGEESDDTLQEHGIKCARMVKHCLQLQYCMVGTNAD